jgi:hypothetical protein
MQNAETSGQNMTTLGTIAAGATSSNRINPCTAAPHSSQVAGETTDSVCGAAGSVSPAPVQRPSHCSPYIYAALRILKEHDYHTYRLTDDPDLPGAILATKGRVTLMVSVVHSRKQVPDGHTLRELFPGRVDTARALVKTSPQRVMIWVSSPVIGWRYYRADIGGISYDWDIAKEMEE